MSYTTAIARNDLGANVLQTWLDRKVLETFEPGLYFYKAGVKPTVPGGYNTIGWAKFDQISEASVETGTTSTDGVSPTAIDFDASVITATPVQYRVVVSLSDMVMELNVINFLEGAAMAVGAAMARAIDKVIQTEIMAGTYVIYGGARTARTAVTASDVLTAAKLNAAATLLDSRYAPRINGYYVGYAHPYQIYDLRSESGTGNWLEVNKYVTPDKIFKGEIGSLNGIRIIMAPFIQPFTSTVSVYPCLVLGGNAYGVADFQTLRSYVTPAVASDSDPLAQRRKVGSKVAFAAKRLQEASMLRIETGVTSLA